MNYNLEKCIIDIACKINMVKNCKKISYNNPWSNIKCTTATKSLKKSLYFCKKHNFSKESLELYTKEKQSYKKILAAQKALYNNKYLESIYSAKNPKDFWDAINFFRKKKSLGNLSSITLDDWVLKYQKFYSTDSIIQNRVINTPVLIPELEKPFTYDELCVSLKKCKQNKSPGENGISYEFLKNLPNNWILYINLLYNKILIFQSTPETWSNIIVKMLYKKRQQRRSVKL